MEIVKSIGECEEEECEENEEREKWCRSSSRMREHNGEEEKIREEKGVYCMVFVGFFLSSKRRETGETCFRERKRRLKGC